MLSTTFRKLLIIVLVFCIANVETRARAQSPFRPPVADEMNRGDSFFHLTMALLEVGAIYYAKGRFIPIMMKVAPAAASRLSKLGKFGRVLSDAATVAAVAEPFVEGYFDNENRLRNNFTLMWGTFLTDPKIIGPAPSGNAEKTYARYAFDKAAERVNSVLQDAKYDFRINPSRVFLSSDWSWLDQRDPPSDAKPGTHAKVENWNFYVPVTDFAFPDPIERIAYSLLCQVLLNGPPWSEKIQQYDKSIKRPWLSYVHPDFDLSLPQVIEILAGKLLGMNKNGNLDDNDKELQAAISSYLDDRMKRMEGEPFPRTKAAFEEKYLSIRPQKFPTNWGRQIGAGTATPCGPTEVQSLFNYTLAPCYVLRLDDLAKYDDRLTMLYSKLEADNVYQKESQRSFDAGFWKVQAEVFSMMLVDSIIGSRISKVASGMNIVARGTAGTMRFGLFFGSGYASDQAFTVIFKGTRWDLNKMGDDTATLLAVAELMRESERFDLSSSSERVHAKALAEKFNKILVQYNPDTQKVLDKLTNISKYSIEDMSH